MRKLLSVREKEVLDTLIDVDNVGLAAMRLGIKTKTIYNMLYRLRKKQLMARHFINVMLNYRRHGEKMDDLLTPRIKVKESDFGRD